MVSSNFVVYCLASVRHETVLYSKRSENVIKGHLTSRSTLLIYCGLPNYATNHGTAQFVPLLSQPYLKLLSELYNISVRDLQALDQHTTYY